MQLLQKKLDEAVLEQIWVMFERNKMCKLTQDDVAVYAKINKVVSISVCYIFINVLNEEHK